MRFSGVTFPLVLCVALPAFANDPPFAPVIIEPSADGQILSPSDVHMATAVMNDPDLGDTHECSDFEIWSVAPTGLAWIGSCVGGAAKVHAHFGDGSFVNAYAGRTALDFDTDYLLRIRHRDSATNWSPYAERPFRTGEPTAVFPMEIGDVLDSPAPNWLDDSDVDMVLPSATNPPHLLLEAYGAGPLLQFSPGASSNAPPGEHGPVRVHANAGSATLTLSRSRVEFTEDDGSTRTIYLPPIALDPLGDAYFWISENGSSYVGDGLQTNPVFATLAEGAPVPWAVQQPGFKVEVFATGFQLPVNIAFVPAPGTNAADPLFYVTELYGSIKVVTRGGDVFDYATNLLNFNPTGEFPGSGELGITGITVEPASGDVFATLLFDNGGQLNPKVVRFASTNGGLSAATQTTVLAMSGEVQGASHQISNISIGPDDLLYVHLGDGFVTATAQNTNSFRGKILRMNLNGTPATNNPFYNAANGTNATDYIFAYGFRNPFGGAWRAADARHYEVENGPSVDRLVRVQSGTNYRWDGSDSSMTNFAIYNWNPAHAPVNLAFIQTNTFQGSGFPTTNLDHVFVTESGPTWATGPQSDGKRIVEFVLSTNGTLVSGPATLVEYNGSGKATAVGLTAGPDGLYFTDLYKDVGFVSPIDRGANILRIRFVGAVDFDADVRSGPLPLSVQFTNRSTAAAAAAWLWDFDDGSTSTATHASHTYEEPGIYAVTLRRTGTNAPGAVRKAAFIHAGNFGPSLLVVGNTNLGAGDSAALDRLDALGYGPVQVVSDAASSTNQAAGKKLVVISSTVLSTTLGSLFRDVPVPVLMWEQNVLDDMQLTGPTENTHHGTAPSQTQVQIVANGHFLAAGLTGTVSVLTAANTFSWGVAGTGATVVASLTTNGGMHVLFAYETGAAMVGLTAPARRVFLFLEDLAAASLTSAGRALFDAAVTWAAGNDLDTDADGMTDDWELLVFGDLHHATAQTDDDGDGVRDRHEFIAGTEATNANSFFRASNDEPVGDAVLVHWQSASNRVYDVDRATNIESGFNTIASNLAATPPANTFTDQPPSADAVFHRIRVRQP